MRFHVRKRPSVNEFIDGKRKQFNRFCPFCGTSDTAMRKRIDSLCFMHHLEAVVWDSKMLRLPVAVYVSSRLYCSVELRLLISSQNASVYLGMDLMCADVTVGQRRTWKHIVENKGDREQSRRVMWLRAIYFQQVAQSQCGPVTVSSVYLRHANEKKINEQTQTSEGQVNVLLRNVRPVY